MWLLHLGLLTASAQPASTVNFEVTGILVNVTRSDGTAWDIGAPPASPGLFGQLMSLAMAGEDSWATVVSMVAKGTGVVISRPDLRVTVETLDKGVPMASWTLQVQPDTYQPSWSNALIRDVAVRDDLSVRLTVVDDDLRRDDPVGVVVFPSSRLLAVARKGGVVWTPTADQTQGTVLYVGLTAWDSNASRPR
jgi:hypothetical protein